MAYTYEIEQYIQIAEQARYSIFLSLEEEWSQGEIWGCEDNWDIYEELTNDIIYLETILANGIDGECATDAGYEAVISHINKNAALAELCDGVSFNGIFSQIGGGGNNPTPPSEDCCQVIDILKADLIQAITDSEVNIQARYRITDSTQGVISIYGVDTNVITTNAFLEGTWDGTTFTAGQWGLYDLSNDKFYGNYTELYKTDFDDLIADSKLNIGAWYKVNNAYVSTAFGRTWTVLCQADTVNSVRSAAWIVTSGTLTGCEYDPTTPTVKITTKTDATAMYLDATQVLAWSWLSTEVYSFVDVYIQTSGGLTLKTAVTEDATVIRLTNVQLISAGDPPLISGQLGTYDPTNDIFIPNVDAYSQLSTAPTITDDANSGYLVNYIVAAQDENNREYICTDNTVGAAVWVALQGNQSDFTPALTPDGTVVTTANHRNLCYTRVGNISNVSILISVECDFSAGSTGQIQIDTFPFLTSSLIIVGNANIEIASYKAGGGSKIPFISIDKNGLITIFTGDETTNVGPFFITVSFAYEIN